MSTKQINDGGEIAYTNGATAIDAGTAVHIGEGIMAIAENALAASASGTLSIRKQTIEMTKLGTTAAIAAGAKFYLTASANTIAATAGSGTQILNWFCEQAVASTATTVRVTRL